MGRLGSDIIFSMKYIIDHKNHRMYIKSPDKSGLDSAQIAYIRIKKIMVRILFKFVGSAFSALYYLIGRFREAIQAMNRFFLGNFFRRRTFGARNIRDAKLNIFKVLFYKSAKKTGDSFIVNNFSRFFALRAHSSFSKESFHDILPLLLGVSVLIINVGYFIYLAIFYGGLSIL